jgi:hypothetical protein
MRENISVYVHEHAFMNTVAQVKFSCSFYSMKLGVSLCVNDALCCMILHEALIYFSLSLETIKLPASFFFCEKDVCF